MTVPAIQPLPLILGASALAGLTAAAWGHAAPLGQAALIGGFAGLVLVMTTFGFAGGWRRLLRERRGGAVRAQLLALALAACLALPLIHFGELIGVRAGGFVFPFGVSVAVGAFLFGIGMQLGGGCASGTLFVAAGGAGRMGLVLAFFIAGGLIATAHWPFWSALPRLAPMSLAGPLGVPGALSLSLAALGALAALTWRLERTAHGRLREPATRARWRGPWPRFVGAVGLALVVALCLVALGRPWGITSGFTLWGAKIAHATGVPIETWDYWRHAMGRVEAPLLTDATSVMNLGIVAGALATAALAGRFAPTLSLSLRDVATAVAGGLLMGYGARIAYGCNIGALLSGIASGSVHGWGWLMFAFAGSWLGVGLRRVFGMDGAPPALAPQMRPS